jgi:signal peptidase I
MTDQRGLEPDPSAADIGPREQVVTDPTWPLGGHDGPEEPDYDHDDHDHDDHDDHDHDGVDAGGYDSDQDGTPPTATRPVKKKMNPLVEWMIVVAVAITSALLVRAYVVQQFAVEGESMLNTLQDGDRVLVNRLSYRLHDPRRGDVVVLKRFDSPNTPERDLIKRVIGLEGETVRVTNCDVFINGQPLIEPYIDAAIQLSDGCGGDQAEITVPEDTVFVLGDHRGKSSDSRVFGAVPFDLLIGRAFIIIWPVGDWSWL